MDDKVLLGALMGMFGDEWSDVPTLSNPDSEPRVLMAWTGRRPRLKPARGALVKAEVKRARKRALRLERKAYGHCS